MINYLKKYILLLLMAFPLITYSQTPLEIWPGDASNNGEANHIDLLYIGVAFDSEGSPRLFLDPSTEISANPTFGTAPYSFNWNVNGNIFNTQNFTLDLDLNVFTEACVTITDADGVICIDCELVEPGPQTDSCYISIDWEINNTLNLASFAPVINGGTPPYTYFWNLGNGLTLTEETPSNIDLAPGTYEVCLEVTDADGIMCENCSDILIGPNVSNDCSIINSGPTGTTNFTNWSAQPLSTPWENVFINELNYAYADCDGNGIVDEVDVGILELNYNEINLPIIPDIFEEDIIDNSPTFELDFTGIDTTNIVPGQLLEIPIVLGDMNNNIDNFYGAAFTISYDSTWVKEGSAQILFYLNTWTNPNNAGLISINMDNYQEQIIEAAVCRINQESVSGFGAIGVFSIIIEDDIGSFLNIDPSLYLEIKQIKQVDENLDDSPVNGSFTSLSIDTSGLSSTKNILADDFIKIFPNPTNNTVTIDAPFTTIETIKLYNTTGQLQKTFYQKSTDLLVGDLPSGIYILQIQTTNGIASKKIMIL